VKTLKINFFLRDGTSRQQLERLRQGLSRFGRLRLVGSGEELQIPQFFLETTLGEKQMGRIMGRMMSKFDIKGTFSCRIEEKENDQEMAPA